MQTKCSIWKARSDFLGSQFEWNSAEQTNGIANLEIILWLYLWIDVDILLRQAYGHRQVQWTRRALHCTIAAVLALNQERDCKWSMTQSCTRFCKWNVQNDSDEWLRIYYQIYRFESVWLAAPRTIAVQMVWQNVYMCTYVRFRWSEHGELICIPLQFVQLAQWEI